MFVRFACGCVGIPVPGCVPETDRHRVYTNALVFDPCDSSQYDGDGLICRLRTVTLTEFLGEPEFVRESAPLDAGEEAEFLHRIGREFRDGEQYRCVQRALGIHNKEQR